MHFHLERLEWSVLAIDRDWGNKLVVDAMSLQSIPTH
jgi:hypothetical protein